MITLSAKIEVVPNDTYIYLDKSNLLSINFGVEKKPEKALPSFGIISNGGSVEFSDKNGLLWYYADKEILPEKAKIEISLNETLTKNSKTIRGFYVGDWNYDVENKTVSLDFKDDLEEWQDIITRGLSLQSKSWTLYEFYAYLRSLTPSKFKFLVNNNILDILQSTTIPSAYLNSDNLWSQWQKLCEVGGICMFQNGDGYIVLSEGY